MNRIEGRLHDKRALASKEKIISRQEKQIEELREMVLQKNGRLSELTQLVETERVKPPVTKLVYRNPPLMNFGKSDEQLFKDQKVRDGSDRRDGHTQIAFVCCNCRLHFVVLTWRAESWKDKPRFCPECGPDPEMCELNRRDCDHEIFQVLESKIFRGARNLVKGADNSV